MNLHEYQGKALFAEYNLPVSKGKVVFKAEDIIDACNDLASSHYTECTVSACFQTRKLLCCVCVGVSV